MTRSEEPIRTVRRNSKEYPLLLKEIPDAPGKLYVQGAVPATDDVRFLAVVGSRLYTPYGKETCERLIAGLCGYPIAIVSGLALGIDGIAHGAALRAGLTTIAVPGSGLDPTVLYPASHRMLARRIVEEGGALVTEFEPMWRPRPESFPQRNRLMAGMSHAVLVIEASERSGTLITARLAVEYNRDVFAVPGPVHSATAKGPHTLIQQGAALIHDVGDIIEALALTRESTDVPVGASSEEESVLAVLRRCPCSRDDLFQELKIDVAKGNMLITSLELKGVIREEAGLLRM